MNLEVPQLASPGVGKELSESPDGRRILDAAMAILRQGEALLEAVSEQTYAQKVPAVFNASMGGHVRHSLDHFSCAMRAMDGGEIDYDARERDRRVEWDRDWALEVTREIRGRLETLSVDALGTSVWVRCEVSYARGSSPRTLSSLGRELAYSIVHAIHHYALIAVMARLLQVALPEQFGMAPSTVAHQEKEGAA